MAQINHKIINRQINDTNTVFFDVDTQHDYLSEASNKAIKNSAEVKKNLAKLTHYAIENNIKILGSVDVNKNTNMDQTDYNKINSVNITNTGNKIPETFVQGTIFVPNKKVSEQLIAKAVQSDSPVLVEKQAYNCFQNPNMDAIVKIISETNNDNNVNKAIVYGVATEYCVKEAVLGLLSRGIKVLLVRDAIGAINEELGKEALKEMKGAGAAIVKISEILFNEEITA